MGDPFTRLTAPSLFHAAIGGAVNGRAGSLGDERMDGFVVGIRFRGVGHRGQPPSAANRLKPVAG